MPREPGVWRVDGDTVEMTPSSKSDEKRLAGVLAAEIIEDVQAALEELQNISDDLAQTPGAREGAADE